MNIILIIISGIIWWTIGYNSFKFWWRHDFDFTASDRSMAIAAPIMGPLTFIVGYIVHSVISCKDTVIAPKFTKK